MQENRLINNKFIGIKVRNARKEAGLTRKELAGMVGITGQTLYRYEKGEINFTVDLLLKIARALEKNFLWFIGESQDENRPGHKKNIDMIIEETKTRQVPVIKKILPEERLLSIANISDYLNVSTKPKTDFAWIVQGDAMAPFLNEGDAVICERTNYAEPNNMVVLRPETADNTDVVRYLLKNNDGRYLLRAANPGYKDIFIDDPQSKIIGVVVQVIKQPEQYKELPADKRELLELGFTIEDIKEDPAIRKTLMIVGRAKNKLSKQAKEGMADMLTIWFKTLEAQETQIIEETGKDGGK
ncbi:helix-turn-helix domain-containing protein [Moorella naiadis]|uniref:LexA family protein n=1 Tax=Moorella naiadis (nom. illeg.) TaxID=3093670 RepID=UPI003D9C8342